MLERNAECELCELHKTSDQVCVFGVGNPHAKIMIVGESPLLSRNKPYEAFRGPAGAMLKKELEENGIDIDDVYFTNMVKCRPDDKSPGNPQIKACRPYLEQELKDVNPQFVLLLGASALKLIKRTKITELRGSIIDLDGRQYMPIFHPAMALRDPGKLPGIQHDIAKFAQLVNGELKEEDEIDWEMVDKKNCDQFLQEFDNSKEFSFDTETTGLLVQDHDFKLNSISFTLDTEKTWVLTVNKNEDPVWASRVLSRVYRMGSKKYGIGHNGKYDNMTLMATQGFRFYLGFDTMLASHTFDENSPHDLKFLARIHCGAPDYDDLTVKEKTGAVGPDVWTRENSKVPKYNAYDSYYTYKLYKFYQARFRKSFKLRRLFTKLVMPAARIFEEADYGGHYIRMTEFEATKIQLTKDVARTSKELQAMSGSKRKINWNSPKQIGELLFGKLGLPITQYTDKGAPSTGESALNDIKDLHPLAGKLVEYRGYQKFLSTYIEGWEELMVGGYLYLSTKLHGTVTGRYSSRLHQVPRDGTIRNLIDAPEEEGWTFACADFSQIELRLAADASQDARLKMIFQTGGDVHASTASEILGIPPEDLTKEQRKMGKPVNFGFLYGMGAPKFQIYSKDNYGVIFTMGESKAYRDRFFDMYAGLPDWHDKMRYKVRQDGYVEYLSGRLRRLPGIFSKDREVQAEAERQAINSPIQGFGSGDLKAMAMVGIREAFDTDTVRIKGEVHDSVLMWIRTSKLKQVLPKIKSIMESPPLFDDFKIELSVPLIVDIDVGTWGKGIPWQEYVATH